MRRSACVLPTGTDLPASADGLRFLIYAGMVDLLAEMSLEAADSDTERIEVLVRSLQAAVSAEPVLKFARYDRSSSAEALERVARMRGKDIGATESWLIVQDRYGSADVLRLEDIDTPVARGGDVLIRVGAAARFSWTDATTSRPIRPSLSRASKSRANPTALTVVAERKMSSMRRARPSHTGLHAQIFEDIRDLMRIRNRTVIGRHEGPSTGSL
jgi:hypothetical protein